MSEQTKRSDWLAVAARKAETYLKQIPPGKLGPAGRLVMNDNRAVPAKNHAATDEELFEQPGLF